MSVVPSEDLSEAAMKELRTEIEIQASPHQVWQALIDLSKYPEWNPFILRAIGKAVPGEIVDIAIRSGSKEMTLHCTVIKADPDRELRWRYHVLLPVLFRGEHRFTIQPLGEDRVRFVDCEVFNGLLVSTQAKDIDTNSRRGFEAMDQALKVRAESVA